MCPVTRIGTDLQDADWSLNWRESTSDLQLAECSLRAARSLLLGDYLRVGSVMPIPQAAARNIR
jgi:hypothetical protein